MWTYIVNMPWYWAGSLLSLLAICLAVFGLFIVRKIVPLATLKRNHDVAGFTFGIIGVIYGVLLGFTIVNVQERFDTIEKISAQEANILVDLYRDSQAFEPQYRLEIRKLIKEYAELVRDKEWKLLEQGIYSPIAQEKVREIWEVFYRMPFKSEVQKIWGQQAIEKLNDFSGIRLLRVYESKQTLGPLMWTLLLLGAVITVLFMYFFGAESFAAQALMTVMLCGCISFILFLIFTLDMAFSGNVSVKATPFNYALETFERWEQVKDQNDPEILPVE